MSGWWRIWARWCGCQTLVGNASLLEDFAVSTRTYSAEEAWRLPVPLGLVSLVVDRKSPRLPS